MVDVDQPGYGWSVSISKLQFARLANGTVVF